MELWKRQPEKIAALSHGGVRGNPCLFPARFFPELLELREDCGGNAVIRRHEEDLVLLEADASELYDVDTVQALEELGFKRNQIYTTMELRMKCGVGKCGRCNIGKKYVCKDGPVFTCDELDEMPDEY